MANIFKHHDSKLSLMCQLRRNPSKTFGIPLFRLIFQRYVLNTPKSVLTYDLYFRLLLNSENCIPVRDTLIVNNHLKLWQFNDFEYSCQQSISLPWISSVFKPIYFCQSNNLCYR